MNHDAMLSLTGQTAADRVLLVDRAGQAAADRVLRVDRAGQTAADRVEMPHLRRSRKRRAARQIAGGAAAKCEGSQRKNSDNPLFQFVFLSSAGEREEAD